MKLKLIDLIALFKETFQKIVDQDVSLQESETDGGVNIHAEGSIQLALRHATPGEFVVANGGEIGKDFFDKESGQDVSMYCNDIESATFAIDGSKTITQDLSGEQVRALAQDLGGQVNKLVERVCDFSREKGKRAS